MLSVLQPLGSVWVALEQVSLPAAGLPLQARLLTVAFGLAVGRP